MDLEDLVALVDLEGDLDPGRRRALSASRLRVLDNLVSPRQGRRRIGLFLPNPTRPRMRDHAMDSHTPLGGLVMRSAPGFRVPPAVAGWEPSIGDLTDTIYGDGTSRAYIEAASIAADWSQSPTGWGAFEGAVGRVVTLGTVWIHKEHEEYAWDHEALEAALLDPSVAWVLIQTTIHVSREEVADVDLGGMGAHANAVVFDCVRKRVIMFDPHVTFKSLMWKAGHHHDATAVLIRDTLRRPGLGGPGGAPARPGAARSSRPHPRSPSVSGSPDRTVPADPRG